MKILKPFCFTLSSGTGSQNTFTISIDRTSGKVINGPFVSFSGTINDINFERMKVKVMVSIFGRKTPIELDFTQIEKEK